MCLLVHAGVTFVDLCGLFTYIPQCHFTSTGANEVTLKDMGETLQAWYPERQSIFFFKLANWYADGPSLNNMIYKKIIA